MLRALAEVPAAPRAVVRGALVRAAVRPAADVLRGAAEVDRGVLLAVGDDPPVRPPPVVVGRGLVAGAELVVVGELVVGLGVVTVEPAVVGVVMGGGVGVGFNDSQVGNIWPVSRCMTDLASFRLPAVIPALT